MRALAILGRDEIGRHAPFPPLGAAALRLVGKDRVNHRLRPLPAPDEVEHGRMKVGRGGDGRVWGKAWVRIGIVSRFGPPQN